MKQEISTRRLVEARSRAARQDGENVTISDDIQHLNSLLDDLDDTEQQQLITQWLETLSSERSSKRDNYATLIAELEAKAEIRKKEAKRLMDLANSDENRAKMLKERLKYFFETNKLKKVETNRYKLSLVKHGGKPPLILAFAAVAPH